jgi:FKBP-type peptidyl-prolyl cis-trans isomerase SlyD
MQFEAQTGQGGSVPVTVIAVTEEIVTVDGNHPLAGKNLNFDVTITEVREASEEELAHGHTQGADGEEQ